MNTPPLLLGAVLLFWGWETGLLVVGAIGAVVLEASRWVRWRWDFSESDMNRVWDLCSVLFLGAAVYSYASTDLVTGSTRFMQWLPMIFFPFVSAVTFGERDSVRHSTYFLLLRRRPHTKPVGQYVSYWYVAICLAAASVANVRDASFYVGVVITGSWLLWNSRRGPVWAWGLALSVVIGVGLVSHVGLNRLQAVVLTTAGELLEQFNPRDSELTQTRTAIGSVGELKQSNRIVLRLVSEYPPEKLRRASFDTYTSAGKNASWSASDGKYADIVPASESSWQFHPGRPVASATISMSVAYDVAILPAPNGPLAINGLLAGSVETNRCGSIRAHDTAPLVRYTVKTGERSTLDAPPTEKDFEVPKTELPVLTQVAGELGLAGQSPVEVLRRVGEFFQGNFSYTCYLKRSPSVSEFLTRERTGHCEYFATAATLLLRQAGIPARYAVGYAVPEEADGNVHLVRDRHAHAWVLAYVGGSWRDFDTTPGSWEAVEEKQKSPFEPLTDFFSALRYYFTAWRYYGDRAAITKWLLMVLPVGLVWFVWRLVARSRRLNRPVAAKKRVSDSEFYRIEKKLTALGHDRGKDETVLAWLTRLEKAGLPSCRQAAELHYAYRFDPRGLTVEQRQALVSEVEKWLAAVR